MFFARKCENNGFLPSRPLILYQAKMTMPHSLHSCGSRVYLSTLYALYATLRHTAPQDEKKRCGMKREGKVGSVCVVLLLAVADQRGGGASGNAIICFVFLK